MLSILQTNAQPVRCRRAFAGCRRMLGGAQTADDLLSGAVGNAAEHGDFFEMLIGDDHVVDAGLAIQDLFLGDGGEHIADIARLAVGDAAVKSECALVARIASEGEGRVGQSKSDATVADAETVDHFFFDEHSQFAVTGADLFELNAQTLSVLVLLQHDLGNRLSQGHIFVAYFVFQDVSPCKVAPHKQRSYRSTVILSNCLMGSQNEMCGKWHFAWRQANLTKLALTRH